MAECALKAFLENGKLRVKGRIFLDKNPDRIVLALWQNGAPILEKALSSRLDGALKRHFLEVDENLTGYDPAVPLFLKLSGQGGEEKMPLRVLNNLRHCAEGAKFGGRTKITGRGRVENFEKTAGGWIVTGWADAGCADKIAVLSDYAFIGESPINEWRPDVTEEKAAGFHFFIPESMILGDAENSLFFYALDADGGFFALENPGGLLGLDPGLSDFEPLTTVRHIASCDVSLSYRCNLDCQYCCLRGLHNAVKPMSVTEFGRIISSTSPHNLEIRSFKFGALGEITIHENFREILDILKNREIPFYIVSNYAKKMDQDDLAILSQANAIYVSIDSPDFELTRNIRTGANIGRIVQNIVETRNTALRNGRKPPKIRILACITRPVLPYLPSLASLAIALQAEWVLFQDVDLNSARGDQSELAFQLDMRDGEFSQYARKQLDTACDMLRNAGINVDYRGSFANAQKRPKSGETKLCLFPWHHAFVKNYPDGAHISPCAYIYSIGKLTENTSFADIINGSRARAIRQGLLTGNLHAECARCRLDCWGSREELRDLLAATVPMGNYDEIHKYLSDRGVPI